MSIQTFGPLSCGAGPIGQFAAKPGAPASAVAAPANPAVLSMVLRSSDMVFPLAMKSAPRAGAVQHPTGGHATEKMDSGLGLGTQPASKRNKANVRYYSIADKRGRGRIVRLVPTADIGLLYSIISFAHSRNASGIVKPSALAVVRLTTRSKLVGCSTGRSAASRRAGSCRHTWRRAAA
jgi:hypothetical protein